MSRFFKILFLSLAPIFFLGISCVKEEHSSHAKELKKLIERVAALEKKDPVDSKKLQATSLPKAATKELSLAQMRAKWEARQRTWLAHVEKQCKDNPASLCYFEYRGIRAYLSSRGILPRNSVFAPCLADFSQKLVRRTATECRKKRGFNLLGAIELRALPLKEKKKLGLKEAEVENCFGLAFLLILKKILINCSGNQHGEEELHHLQILQKLILPKWASTLRQRLQDDFSHCNDKTLKYLIIGDGKWGGVPETCKSSESRPPSLRIPLLRPQDEKAEDYNPMEND